LQKLQARKSGEKAKSEARVSTRDPQARVMKQSDGGLALSYNAQISTDAAHGLIVGVAVTQEADDSAQLLPAVDRVEERLKKQSQQMVADGGYTTRDNIEKLAERDRFLGEHAVGKCTERNHPAGPVAPKCIPLSAGRKSLRLPERAKSCIRRDDAKCGQGCFTTATKPKQKIAKPARVNRSVVRTMRSAAVRWRVPKKARW
jgi:Transposase DDE domain